MSNGPCRGILESLLILRTDVDAAIDCRVDHHDHVHCAARVLAAPKGFNAPHQVRFVETGDDHHDAKVRSGRLDNLPLAKPESLEIEICFRLRHCLPSEANSDW